MKILIYGINGFLGGNLGSYLSRKHDVIGVGSTTDLAAGLSSNICKYYKYDGRDIFAEEQPDIVVFCISLDHNKCNDSPTNTIDINLKIYARLIESIRKQQDWSGKLVYLSTAQVLQDGDIRNESVDITNIYGLTHHYCEHVGRYYLPTTCYNLRLPNVVGIPLSQRANIWWNIIPELLHKAINTGRMSVKSDGTATRTFLSVMDFCFHVENLINTHLPATNYNITTDQRYSIAEVVNMIAKNLTEQGIEYKLELPPNFVTGSTAEFLNETNNKNLLQLDKNQKLENIIYDFIKYIEDQPKCKQ